MRYFISHRFAPGWRGGVSVGRIRSVRLIGVVVRPAGAARAVVKAGPIRALFAACIAVGMVQVMIDNPLGAIFFSAFMGLTFYTALRLERCRVP